MTGLIKLFKNFVMFTNKVIQVKRTVTNMKHKNNKQTNLQVSHKSADKRSHRNKIQLKYKFSVNL